MSELKNLIKNGNLSFFGYSYKFLPQETEGNKRAEVFFKEVGQEIHLQSKKDIIFYSGYKDTPWDTRDVVFFDQDATKSICIGFPTNSKFVLISLKYPRYFVFIILGVLRRLLMGTIKIESVLNLSNEKRFNPWLVVRCKKQKTNSLNLSESIGISGFITFLNQKKIRYVVPKFFENLPHLGSKYADLDIIVDKDAVDSVRNFLESNPGSIPVDVYTSEGNDYHGISYIPPVKANQVLSNAVIGPGGALIPAKQDAIDILVYHALYHKGHMSRIPSIHNKYNLAYEQENKYLKAIKNLCEDKEFEGGNTLEQMDNYMAAVGWKPALDTLNKMAAWNGWVRDTLSENVDERLPLYAFILKEGVKSYGFEELIKKNFQKEGFLIIEEVELIGDIRQNAITNLRGGIWNDSLANDAEVTNFYPYKILITWDTLERTFSEIARAKQRVRKIIDQQKTSLIHSSDNYSETVDYIEVCIPEKFAFYRDADAVTKKFKKHSLKKKTMLICFESYLALFKAGVESLAVKIFSH